VIAGLLIIALAAGIYLIVTALNNGQSASAQCDS
jgi:hypothetical protein